MKVFVVDDEYYTLIKIKKELEALEGIEVCGAYQDGETMLNDFERINPDVVFLDIEMPGMNGLTLCSRILETDPSTRVVFITAYNKYAVDAFDLNALDYIVKPITQERLKKTISRLSPLEPVVSAKKLYIRCFKRFSVLADGKELNLKLRTGKALELMAYLTSEKGIFVSKDKIIEKLWPDLDKDRGISQLYLAYYYIKKQEKTLGVVLPLESSRGKMRMNLEATGCDLLEFDKLFEKTKVLSNTNIEAAENAEALYIGALLEDDCFEWDVILQQEYDIAYEALLKKLIEYHTLNNNADKAKKYDNKLRNYYYN